MFIPLSPRRQAVVVLSLLCSNAFVKAQNDTADETEQLPTFGDTVPILGSMARTDVDFRDGLAIDLFSPFNRTIVVKQNTSPLPGHFVSGTTGEPFIALSNYSYILRTNDSASDLIGKIELPYDPMVLARLGVQEANTYVGTLAPDGKSWVVDETRRNVHRSENKTRIIKMTSLDGEFMLLGRKEVDTANVFVQYGFGATRTVNVTGGSGRQEAEFVDGLRFEMIAKQGMALNVDLVPLRSASVNGQGMLLNSFAWAVNTSRPDAVVNATMRVPFNRNMLARLRPGGASPTTMLVVAKRPLNASSSDGFEVLNPGSQTVNELPDDRIVVRNVQQLDGHYVLLVTRPSNL